MGDSVDWMGLVAVVGVLAGVAYRWAGSRLVGIDGDAPIAPMLAVRKLAPAVVIVAVCVFAALGLARCG